MRLALLRHGRAERRGDWEQDDRLRPLTDDGRKRTKQVLTVLAPLMVGFHEIWTSPWTRARQTANIASKLWDLPVHEHEWLAGDTGAEGCIGELPERETIMVGHEPQLGELIGLLTGGPPVPLRKAGLAILDGAAMAGGMTITALLPPAVALELA